MALSPEIPPQSRIKQEVGTPRYSDLQKERSIVNPQVKDLQALANSMDIDSQWIDNLQPTVSKRIKIIRQYTMEKILEEVLRNPVAKHQISRPPEDIRYALGGIRNNVTELYTDLYTMAAIDGMTLVGPRKDWKAVQSSIKNPEEEKIKVAMNLAEKEAELDILTFLLSSNKENIIYQIGETDKKRTLRNHP